MANSARAKARLQELKERIEGEASEKAFRGRESERTRGMPQPMPYSSIGSGLPAYKKGGKVKKTGPAKLHKGERVLTAKQAKKATPAKLRAATRKPAARTRRK